jgi:hypothetical protein
MQQWTVWKKHWSNIPAGNKLILMERLVLFLILSVTGYHAFSQDFMLDKRWKIKNKMERFYAENNRKFSSAETDSSLTYSFTDSLSLPATYIFYFNKTDRCIIQEAVFSCDSCLTKSVQQSLSNKFIKWKKTGPETYYAGFPYNTSMEQVSKNGRFILRYVWAKRKDLKAGAE